MRVRCRLRQRDVQRALHMLALEKDSSCCCCWCLCLPGPSSARLRGSPLIHSMQTARSNAPGSFKASMTSESDPSRQHSGQKLNTTNLQTVIQLWLPISCKHSPCIRVWPGRGRGVLPLWADQALSDREQRPPGNGEGARARTIRSLTAGEGRAIAHHGRGGPGSRLVVCARGRPHRERSAAESLYITAGSSACGSYSQRVDCQCSGTRLSFECVFTDTHLSTADCELQTALEKDFGKFSYKLDRSR
ncbi:hypothetical protein NDU88_004900 [Pleurodeles waltl]|uniref:Uncharacterized protein n=1 Tax=Pleurodeles waltl TaxID=8319 RepID=A0AAV7NNM5_PLEWA|nr:hypothetical protein NDU88_004900 [Pleurodeles waltl]